MNSTLQRGPSNVYQAYTSAYAKFQPWRSFSSHLWPPQKSEKIIAERLENQYKKPSNEVTKMFTRLVPQRMQSFSPGDDQESHFQAIFGLPTSPNKNSPFFKTGYFQLFQALGPFPSSSPCPKHIPQCPSWSLGPSGSLVLTNFFVQQNFHFREFGAISKFSAFSGPGSITSVFFGSR